jgi:transitional endoplasmic reticulum ATPase
MSGTDPLRQIQIALLKKHSQSSILKTLEQMIQHDGGMFRDTELFKEFRKYAMHYRIDLLMQWKRFAEALAWLCLETELNPTNVEAQALKKQLKKRLYFAKDSTQLVANGSQKEPLFDWGPVAGMRRIKTIIERDFILPFKEPELYGQYHVKLPRGMILYGPPGCGKTFLVKQISRLLNFSYFEINPSRIASTYVHGTQSKIKEMFDEAKRKKPSLLFIDELDAFVPNRQRSDVSFHYQAEVNEFLLQFNDAYKNGVFVVGATNYLSMVDDAVKRPGRFDKKIFVGPPDIEARIDAFQKELANRPNNIEKWVYLGEETENYTFAEIRFIVEQTARQVASAKKPFIDLNDLMKTVLENPPQFSDVKMREYSK